MYKCPLCHASIRDDFGLTECAECGAQLIVHMDGRVEYQGTNAHMTGKFESEAPMEELREIGFEAPAEDFVPPGQEGLPEDDLIDPPPGPEKIFLGGNLELPEEPVEDFDPTIVTASEPEPEPEPESEEPQDYFSTFSEEPVDPPAAYNASPTPSSPDLADVASFGNSDLSGGREGPLRYNLFIDGIDTVDVREAFREAITDRKLMWDIDNILRSVRNGRVNIPNVAPTKAYILINRLRGMPVHVRWEQYAITQT